METKLPSLNTYTLSLATTKFTAISSPINVRLAPNLYSRNLSTAAAAATEPSENQSIDVNSALLLKQLQVRDMDDRI